MVKMTAGVMETGIPADIRPRWKDADAGPSMGSIAIFFHIDGSDIPCAVDDRYAGVDRAAAEIR